jgi:DNA-binding NarL/FixJ family response regulator
MTAIRVLLVDDQPLARAGLHRIIESDPAVTVVGEAADGVEAVRQAMVLRPDIVLMDIRMPVLDGIEATRRIHLEEESIRVVVLTTFGVDDYVVEALRAGASAFVLKEAPPERILATIHDVAAGHAVIDPAMTRAVIERLALRPHRRDLAALLDQLTLREREVLQLLARGLSNAEIAASLFISEGTTKTHITHILTKLNVRDRAQAIVLAHDAGV